MEFVGSDKRADEYSIAGNLINDLSVIELPKEALKRNKLQKTPRAEQPSAASPKLLDDAIIFAKPRSTSGGNSQVSDSPRAAKKKVGGSAKSNHKDEDTWNDDVSHIKKSQDFDFASNLALFDKASVFKDLKSKDTVSSSSRLAGHNKVDSPAKKNYDNKEMVLNDKQDTWDSITASENEAKVHKLNFEENLKKGKVSLLKRTVPEPLEQPAKPQAEVVTRPPIFSPKINSDIKFKMAGKPISFCSPLQMLEIERLSIDNFGCSNNMFVENASFGLTQLVIKVLGGSSRLNTHNKPPLVVLLVGNNRAGAKALAAGRHLTNRGLRVIAFVLNSDISEFTGNESRRNNDDIFYDAKEEFDNSVKDQLMLFIKFGGKVLNNFQQLLKSIKGLDSPLELVIDAIQGYDDSLSDLWGDELKTCLKLIGWVNQQKAKIVSIDIASGLDGGSGQFSLSSSDIEEHQGSDVSIDNLRIHPHCVVGFGIPVIGVLHAYNLGEIEVGDWNHYLIDIGIPNKVYNSKGSLRKFNNGFSFGEQWVKELTIEK